MSLAKDLAGRRILITGATGFIGEALLRTLLTDVPEARPVLLVRPKTGQRAADRVARVLRKKTFAPAVAAAGGPAELLARVEVVEGDLTEPPALPQDVDVVVHCAGEVSFDPPVQEAFAANVTGTRTLLQRVLDASASPERAARGQGPVHYVHVSTAYVGGRRRGPVPEGPVEHSADWRDELAAGLRLAQRLEDDSRSPENLTRFIREAEAEHGLAGPLTAAADAERRRVAWVLQQQKEAGRQRGHSLGWTDVYTFTKALGERVVEEFGASLPVSVVRPSIVESALVSPHPGWIEGFKMAEPIILSYGRGELPEVPANPDSTMDIVPVDQVVNALVAVCATRPEPGSPQYFHVSSGARNPLTMRHLYELVKEHFEAHPFEGPDGEPVPLPTWSFPGKTSVERRLAVSEVVHGGAEKALRYIPRSDRVRGWSRSLDRAANRLELLRLYSDLYQVYTQSELHFVDDNTLALHRSLDDADRAVFGFDTADIDWAHYIRDVHTPAVTAPMRKMDALRRRRTASAAGARRVLKPAAQDAPRDVVAVFNLDGTLLSSNVIESYLWVRLPGLGPVGRAREVGRLVKDLPELIGAERRDRGDFLRLFYRRYRGADVATLEALVDQVVTPHVLGRVSQAAVARVRQHREAGHRTVLLTGTVTALTRPLAPLFDEVVGAELVTDEHGAATGHLTSPPLVGEGRAAWLVRYAQVHGYDLSRSYAYADSHSDLPLLRAVGLPTAVSPDVPLLRAARAASWPVETWASAGAPSEPGDAGPRRRWTVLGRREG